MSLDPSRRALVTGLVGVLGGGAYFLTQSGDTATQEQVSSFHSSDETSALGVDLAGKPIMGSPEAPIQMYYWTDFQCPFCGKFERETLPDLVREYVDPGTVRIVFISLPYFGGDSMTAAVAGKCVWEQVRDAEPSAYWNWHTAIFEEQGEKNSGWAATENLLEYTRSVDGVDADALETCLDEQRSTFETQVDADAEHARSLGVSATPTFAILDRDANSLETLVGAQPKARFDEAIERVKSE